MLLLLERERGPSRENSPPVGTESFQSSVTFRAAGEGQSESADGNVEGNYFEFLETKRV